MTTRPTFTLTSIQFLIEPEIGLDTAVGTLEAILAIARRGGITLFAMHAEHRMHGMEVRMQLDVDPNEHDSVTLFVKRLENTIGVCDLRLTGDSRRTMPMPEPEQADIALHACTS